MILRSYPEYYSRIIIYPDVNVGVIKCLLRKIALVLRARVNSKNIVSKVEKNLQTWQIGYQSEAHFHCCIYLNHCNVDF